MWRYTCRPNALRCEVHFTITLAIGHLDILRGHGHLPVGVIEVLRRGLIGGLNCRLHAISRMLPQ